MFPVLEKRHLNKLKTILQSNLTYILILIVVIVYSACYITIPKTSKYNIDSDYFKGQIIDIHIDGNYLSMVIKDLEKLQVNYYFKKNEEKLFFIDSFELGDYIEIFGKLKIPSKNTNFNLFNYRKYLYYEKIYYILEMESYTKIKENDSILYKIKNLIINRIKIIPKSSNYLNALILGDDRYISSEVYQKIGISHLLAISGMHIGIFTKILSLIFSKIPLLKKIKNWLIIIFLLCYMFLTGLSPSVIRAVTFFIIVMLNNVLKLNIKILNLYILTISIMVVIEPFIIFKISFLFSGIISLGLILFSSLINKRKNYFSKLFMTSFLSFLIGLPICLFYFYQINYLSIIYNLLFIPFMSLILFPLSLITFVFPFFDNITCFFINIFEYLANICSLIPSVLVFKKLNFLTYIFYMFLIFISLLSSNRKVLIIIFCIIILIHYNYNNIFKSNNFMVLDVGQGDSLLYQVNNKNILIDTGGKINYNFEGWKKRKKESNITDNIIIPMLKSSGISKLEYLVLTHGDYDHMGEAINLVENFKVEKVIFNCGEFNELEQELIKILDKKKIPYYSCIKELNIDDNKLYFLNNNDYGNENDNSSVIYTELNNHKFLFMGDAGLEVEDDLIERYKLQDIDVLKVGHHGSKTSSSKNFVNEINPKYSIISVGKNNRYGHPNKEVLNNLNDSKIYRTDIDGSIMFKIKNNKLKIETCSP